MAAARRYGLAHAAGWGAATILGVALGALIASSALTRDLFEPTIEFCGRCRRRR